MKTNMIKGLFTAFVVLGLAACSGAEENQVAPTAPPVVEQGVIGTLSENGMDLAVFNDFPEWWLERMAEAHLQIFLEHWTAEDLEEARIQAETMNPEMLERTQHMIVAPGESGGSGSGTFMMTEEGLVEVDLDDLDL